MAITHLDRFYACAKETGQMQEGLVAAQPGRKRRLRVSLRAFMVCVLIVGGALGYYIFRVREQKAVVVAILNAGGRVKYAGEWTKYFYNAEDRPSWWIPWLLEPIGPDWLLDVKQVTLVGGRSPKVNDECMPIVASLRHLESLNLNGCKALTDAGIEHLSKLQNLMDLELSFSGATAASLRSIKNLTRLRRLDMQSTAVGDDDLVYLENMKSLEWLSLGYKGSPITGRGLAHLRGLSHLRHISIPGSLITSPDLAALHDMLDLEHLIFSRSQISDLQPIEHLAKITTLFLDDNPIDDSGLAAVASLKNLGSLHLNKTKITDAGMRALAGLTSLLDLYLDKTAITNEGLKSVSGLGELRQLSINGTAIDDAGLLILAGLDKLSLLSIETTGVTDAGISNLQGMRNCEQVAIGNTAVTDAGIAAANAKRPTPRFARIGLWPKTPN